MREVAIAGSSMTSFSKHTKSGIELFLEASLLAIESSGLEPRDIDALFLGNCLGIYGDRQAHMAPFVHSAMGLKISASALRFESACATATIAIKNAILSVGAGIYDIVLAGGTEKLTSLSTSIATRIFSMASHAQYEFPTGITFPGIFAMSAHMYSDKYGIKITELKKHMAEVAVKNHFNGYENSKAHLRKIISVEDVLNSAMVADPLQTLDCCPFSDGASAIVIMSAEMASDLVKKPIFVAGMGQGSSGPLCIQRDLTRSKSREIASKIAYSEAGILPRDVDVCELHDCFTIAEIIAVEDLGFYDFGKGYVSASSKDTYINSNYTSINPSGGLKSKGHPIGATGAAQVTEIVEQLRGESENRQVYGAKFGLIDTMGGGFGTVCNIILRS